MPDREIYLPFSDAKTVFYQQTRKSAHELMRFLRSNSYNLYFRIDFTPSTGDGHLPIPAQFWSDRGREDLTPSKRANSGRLSIPLSEIIVELTSDLEDLDQALQEENWDRTAKNLLFKNRFPEIGVMAQSDDWAQFRTFLRDLQFSLMKKAPTSVRPLMRQSDLDDVVALQIKMNGSAPGRKPVERSDTFWLELVKSLRITEVDTKLTEAQRELFESLTKIGAESGVFTETTCKKKLQYIWNGADLPSKKRKSQIISGE